MKFYAHLIFLLPFLLSCGKKNENTLIGNWSFNTRYNNDKNLTECQLEFKKDASYKMNCKIKINTDQSDMDVLIITIGNWTYREKNQDENDFFLMKPTQIETQTISYTLGEYKFTEEDLKNFDKWERTDAQVMPAAGDEVKFKVISEDKDKLFLEIISSTEEEFPVGSFLLNRVAINPAIIIKDGTSKSKDRQRESGLEERNKGQKIDDFCHFRQKCRRTITVATGFDTENAIIEFEESLEDRLWNCTEDPEGNVFSIEENCVKNKKYIKGVISANCKTGDYRVNGKPWLKFIGDSKSSERDFDIKIFYADKPYIATLDDGQNTYFWNLELFSKVCPSRVSRRDGKVLTKIEKVN